jgi:hypothetical protein
VIYLVAMAVELDDVRTRFVPMLFLPLDSQILAHPGLFTEHELAGHGLSGATAEERGRPFHLIHFDLLWNGRQRNRGSNLFETNP